MKYLYPFLTILVLSVAFSSSYAQPEAGELIETVIPAPSLEHNLFAMPAEEPIAVYLPPSYSTSEKSYPVVYFLPGFGDIVRYYTRYGVYQGFILSASMDQLIREGKIKEMIVVIGSGANFMGGSFYVNSPVNGNWEDFIVHDLVTFVDNHFRTIPSAASRGLAGHSMGGFGALNLGMHHPEVFGSIYALSPGLFDPHGLSKFTVIMDSSAREQYFTKRKEFDGWDNKESAFRFLAWMSNQNIVVNDYNPLYAYGSAFAPNQMHNAPYMDYPYKKVDGKVVADSVAWKKYDSGLGGWAEKVSRQQENLLKLKSLTIEYGEADEYTFIPDGCRWLSELLIQAGISHKLVPFDGQHQNKLRERIEQYLLPSMSSNLVFDSK